MTRSFRYVFPRCRTVCVLLLAALPLLTSPSMLSQQPAQKGQPKFELHPGDRICIVGNALAERMQHDGWLETYLHARFPKHDLVFRNLGFTGDEITTRLRSANFGSPDKWLTHCKADVIFAFFGYNESFAGEAGLEKFKKDLDGYLIHLLSQSYNGKSAPRVVLFSPIAQLDYLIVDLPDGTENNKRLELYAGSMSEIAKANNAAFVDLFHSTQFKFSVGPLSTLLDKQEPFDPAKQVSIVIDQLLFPSAAGASIKAKNATKETTNELTRKLRQAILDRNKHWFNRYRTVDGYSIYGARADLKFVAGQTNRVVMQREMEILDQMTANRDKVVWAAAQGKEIKPDDSNIPEFIPVVTNKPGKLEGGAHLYLDGGEDAIAKMKLAKGMKINLFASEKDFPDLVNPVQMSWDTKGRLWVAVWPTYPHWKPGDPMNDKILIFEDTKGTGKADMCTVFADGLHCPTGFEFWNNGVLLAQAPYLVYLADSKGGDKADTYIRMLGGLDSADTHHTSNSFVLDPGGALYFQEGTFHHSQVETPWGPPVRNANAGVYRFEPRTHKFDVYVNFGFANPHGHVFDRWGQDIVIDGTGSEPYHAALFSGHLPYPARHARPPMVYSPKTRPCPGMEILSSKHFPDDMQGTLLVGNVIGILGILQYKLNDKGASFGATEMPPIVTSSDPNFRPSDFRMGPDGAIYFIDWHNAIIGHMQHNLRDPSRDHSHGRVYRITYEDRPLSTPAKIAGEPIDKLLDLLKDSEDRVRYRARIELTGRDSKEVIAALGAWIKKLDSKDAEFVHHMLEALWLHQNHNIVNVDLLNRMLQSSDFRARAAATRVLCYWRDRVPEPLELLKKLAADEHPRVRLEAIRAASFFGAPEAIEVSLVSLEQPTDRYLDFVRGETAKTLDPIVKRAIAEGKSIKFTTKAGERFFVKNVALETLLTMKRAGPVYAELLWRKGVRDEFRKEAVTGLAKLRNKSELAVLLDAIQTWDEATAAREESTMFDLVRLLSERPAKELQGIRDEIEKLVTLGKTPVTRQLGFVALIAADGGTDKAWAQATKSIRTLQELLATMPLVRDPSQRATLYPKVEPLLKGLPKELAPLAAKGKSVFGRYVRVEIPGKKKTLTLAEVEVISDGQNVARQGKATQKNTSNEGDASRAIDGITNGKFNAGGQTHTEENISDPWWEVDLGAEFPISSIVIHNRTDGKLGQRLAGHTLKVLDAGRHIVFEAAKLPAPDGKATHIVGTDSPDQTIRRAAMSALVSVRGQETAAFAALAGFVNDEGDRHAAVAALQKIPVGYWPKDRAKPLLDSVLDYVRKVPAAQRTSPAVLEALQFADNLTTLLPLQDARIVRKELSELSVRIIRIGTVPDQMRFDKEHIVVKAGKPVEIFFDNTDMMPHNLVILQPGSLEEIGNLGENTATQADAMTRQYVPATPKVLFSTRLLQPRESQKLAFTAPTQPGVYPMVCTYPGHWRRMYAALYVVEDIDDYLADAPTYLAKHPLPILDDMLKFTRPRTEWKLDDLATSVEKMEPGRSYANGKHLFLATTCTACHKMNGIGIETGPDLTKLDPKMQTPLEVLRDILEPSLRINEKFQSWIIELNNGKSITGLIAEENPQTLKLLDNPLANAPPISINVADIASRKKSPTSIMPKGLLDQLTREEILDLIAYVVSAGNPEHALFRGGHEHGHGGGHGVPR